MKLKKRIAELGKKVITLEYINKEMTEELETKNNIIKEMEEKFCSSNNSLMKDMSDVKSPKNRFFDNPEIQQALLTEENNILSEKVAALYKKYQQKKLKYKITIERLENQMICLKSNDNRHKPLKSIKRSAELIRFESKIRQKNIYIDSLVEKIKELQNSNKDHLNKSNVMSSQVFKKDSKAGDA